ncbi:hypothetical protein F5Y17DRAFT_463403 [Xylariaceae sp. FL0594]|nr:hypothetical protein F5Y17DRAFT_463403 [Xylariaceae sp. FL0594]
MQERPAHASQSFSFVAIGPAPATPPMATILISYIPYPSNLPAHHTMRASTVLALLSTATAAVAGVVPKPGPGGSPTSRATSDDSIPCPTTPTDCSSRLNGHLICLNARTWCNYVDTTRYTPAYYPVDLVNPCASCLPTY